MVRTRHRVGGNAPNVSMRHASGDDPVRRQGHGGPFDPTFPTDGLYGSVVDREPVVWTDLAGGFVGEGNIQDGVVTGGTFETVPPALPTSLVFVSSEAVGSDGTVFIRVVATWVDPVDTDLHAVVVVIYEDDGADPSAPDLTLYREFVAGAGVQTVTIDGLRGATVYWGTAFAVDVLGNRSALLTAIRIVTVGDSVAPAVPTGVKAVEGFRGAAVRWVSVDASDLAVYELDYSVDIGTGLAPLGVWTTLRGRTTVMWVSGLTPGTRYWFRVRAIDRSGNASAYSPDVLADTSCVPTQVGSEDIAANSITSAMVVTAGLTADVIKAGTLAVGTTAGVADGIVVYDTAATTSDKKVGQWDELGIRVYAADDQADYLKITDGELLVYRDGVLVTAITPDGIDASAVRYGRLSGGHNLIRNSSFESGPFSAETVVVDSAFTLSSQSRTSKAVAVISIDAGTW